MPLPGGIWASREAARCQHVIKNYSKATWFEDSLKLDPTHVIALRYLGSTGGDNVSARTNDQAGPDSSRPGYYHRVKIDYASSLIIPGA